MKVLVYTIERGDLGLSKKAKERIRRRVHKARAQVIFEDDHEEAVREIEDTDILFGYITPEMLRNAKGLWRI